MSGRQSRLHRDLPVDLDLEAMLKISEILKATQQQYLSAYGRALNRTAATLRKRAMADIKSGLAPRNLTLVRKRLLSFRLQRGATMDEGKIWFGLNAVKLKDLKGRVRGRIRPRHEMRSVITGRYIAGGKRITEAGFDPQGKLLTSRSFLNGEVGRTRSGRRTVLIRNLQTRRTTEAEIDIYEPMLNVIEDNAFADVGEVFLHHFEVDLRGRVQANIKL
ncbi:hypothetical protein SC206_18340 [Rouxiella sp. T17]|uniref:hypothetical protein n=1 Tax=Rouxiella sp. T17 TaxID=3085684 RepID=UPI002FC6843F